MRILITNGHLRPGGVERSLVSFLHAIDYTKHSVDLLLLEGGGAFLTQIPKEVNVRFVDLQPVYGGFFSTVGRLLKAGEYKLVFCKIVITCAGKIDVQWMKWLRFCGFSADSYDRVFAYRVGFPAEYAAYAVKAPGKYVWWHHGDFHYDQEQVRRWDRVFREIKNVVCVSNGTAEMIAEHFACVKDRIRVLPNIIPVQDIAAKAAAYDPYRGTGQKVRIVTVGRFSEEKRMIDAVYTAEKLLQTGFSDFTWYLVGDGALLKKVQEETASKGLEDYIICVGEKHNPYPYMANADIYVHLSRVESQGLTILEAMSLHVPCVVVRSAGPLEYVRDYENALFAVSDPADIADKILLLLRDRQLWKTIKENSRCPDRFREDYLREQIEALITG